MNDNTALNQLAELNRLKDVSLLDWNSPAMHEYEHNVGSLVLRVSYAPNAGQWDWTLTHPRAGQLAHGSSETREVAKLEAITYAAGYVRNNKLQGLLA
jgi:hypothetical protein